MTRYRHTILLPLLILAGCGVETATTTAVAAKAKQEEVRQGQQLKEDLTNQVNAASQAEQQRLDAAAKGQ